MAIEFPKEVFESEIVPLLEQEGVVYKKAQSSRKYSSEVFIDPVDLTEDEMDAIYKHANDKSDNSLKSKISAYRSLIKNIDKSKVNIHTLETGLNKYLSTNVIDGWIYKINKQGIQEAYLVSKITSKQTDNGLVVSITGKANKAHVRDNKSGNTTTWSFMQDNVQKKTVSEVLASVGLYHETQELKDAYLEKEAVFLKYMPMQNAQFIGNGIALESESSWRVEEIEMTEMKLVNDEALIKRYADPLADPEYWRARKVEKGFESIPYHTQIYMYSLNLHTNVWVDATQIQPYTYDKTIKDKLVLPVEHRDLIDILVNDMDIIMEDIVKGKSGGTTILCAGEPGLGKTLSAEVYAEVIEKPLYRVHSGQLGLDYGKLEATLEDILRRAERWGAVLLIDEADVYIRRRNNDLVHNAVVASFLRTMEYFSGLMFLTTNRYEDVDDAILSRCIATIQYEYPTEESATRIWKVLSTQFGISLDDSLIKDLVDTYPKVSGRDIKELLKLSYRFAKGKQIPLTMDVFRKCSQFRGIRK